MVMKGTGRMWIAAALAMAALAALAPVSWAGDPVGKLSATLRVGVGGFDMGPINSGISRSNQRLLSVPETANWDLPERIHYGFNVGGELNYDLLSAIRLGVVYGTMWGTTSVDFLQKIDVEPRTGFILTRALYRLPYRPGDNMSLRLFAGPIFLTGSEVKITHENTSDASNRLDSMTIKASGTGVAAGLAGEYTLGDRFSLTFEGGYQFAKGSFESGSWTISDLADPLGDDDGDAIPNNQDPVKESYLWGFLNERYQDPELGQQTERAPTVREDLDIDFSGFILQAGFRVYIF